MSEDSITPLSARDQNWLERAEKHILELIRSKYEDAQFTRTKEDLVLVQRLVDDEYVKAADQLEAQCIGVVLGNVFVAATSMRWMRVTNEFGDMIALHSKPARFTLYPLSMVSKRLEDGRVVDLVALYEDLATSLHIKNGEG